jgi:hypothetical protein
MPPAQPLDSETRHFAEGEAALFLVESLFITLVEQGILAKEPAIAAIEAVIDTKRLMAEERDEPRVSAAAAGIASRVANSLLGVAQPPEDAPAPGKG